LKYAFKLQITKPKTQNTNKSQIPIFNDQNVSAEVWAIGDCDLNIIWDLLFGAWNLSGQDPETCVKD